MMDAELTYSGITREKRSKKSMKNFAVCDPAKAVYSLQDFHVPARLADQVDHRYNNSGSLIFHPSYILHTFCKALGKHPFINLTE
jgi:hypothetical protein